SRRGGSRSSTAQTSALSAPRSDDANGFFARPREHPRLHCRLADRVDLSPKRHLQIVAQADEIQEAATRPQLAHDVDVAVRAILIPGRRAEQLDGNGAVRPGKRPNEVRLGTVAAHALRCGEGGIAGSWAGHALSKHVT